MKPVKFKQQNCVYAENQKQYIPLPVHKISEPEGRVISCWKGGLWDRLRFLFWGRIFLSSMTFGQDLQPLQMWSKNPIKERFWIGTSGLKHGSADLKGAKKHIRKERKKNKDGSA